MGATTTVVSAGSSTPSASPPTALDNNPVPGLPSRGPCGDGAYLPSPFWCWRRPTIHIRETTTAPSGMAPCSRLLASAKFSPRRSGSYRRFTCLGGIFSGGLAVTVYSPPMTGNRPELPGSSRRFEIVNPVVAQWETSNNKDYQDLRVANPLVVGSSPTRPTSEAIFQPSVFLVPIISV